MKKERSQLEIYRIRCRGVDQGSCPEILRGHAVLSTGKLFQKTHCEGHTDETTTCWKSMLHDSSSTNFFIGFWRLIKSMSTPVHSNPLRGATPDCSNIFIVYDTCLYKRPIGVLVGLEKPGVLWQFGLSFRCKWCIAEMLKWLIYIGSFTPNEWDVWLIKLKND